ncbi:MAG: M23 family metallopeptidase [Proteobacteria bacterium]|nr:M23 family metallopeptidase [Pseudomonadota bacterium]
MSHFSIILVPGDRGRSRRYAVSKRVVKLALVASFFGLTAAVYGITDYMQLRALRLSYLGALHENRNIRGEARVLMSNLEEVKSSLGKVREYTSKLGEIANLQTASVSKKTGISAIKLPDRLGIKDSVPEEESIQSSNGIPATLKFDSLVFKPVFQRLGATGFSATNSAFDLQHVISALSQQKTLLASVPSMTPVDGWITSGFGARMSPFTGESAYHKGIDVAAPVGTPILAPADGVVVFSGKKEGFGNFVMIAHGYGVVTGYGHNAQNLVIAGKVIKRGEQLATIGQTGRTTGPHLHYEIWVNGRVVDPKRFILSPDDLSLALK